MEKELNDYQMEKELNDYQKEEKEKAEKLAEEIKQLGFIVKVVNGDNGLSDWQIILTNNDIDYQIRQDYKGFITLFSLPYRHYKDISSHKVGEIREKYKINNVKILTTKKLQALIDRENAINTEIKEAEEVAKAKKVLFLAEIMKSGLEVKFNYDRSNYNEDGNAINGEIIGGTIEKNGIVFDFSLCENGYISKEIKLSYKVDNTIKNFIDLANNDYKTN
jgi:uncharacterized protein YggL (DUF469 family)